MLPSLTNNVYGKEAIMAKPRLMQVIKSVLAAAVGIQNDANRVKDFQHGSLSQYVIVGLIATILFVIALISLVSAIV